MMDEEIININPVYVAGIKQLAGTESNLVLGNAHVVVAMVGDIFMSSIPSLIQLQSIPSYLLGLSGALQAGGMTAEQVITQWHAGAAAPLSVAMGDASLTGFEVPTGSTPGFGSTLGQPLDAEGAAYVWDPESTYSMVSAEGNAAWIEVLMCMNAAVEAELDFTPLCFAEGMSGHGIQAALGPVNFYALLDWISLLTGENDPFYYAVVQGGMVAQGLAGVADAANWVDIGLLQFATGSVVYGLTGTVSTSVIGLGLGDALPLTFAPELACYAAEYGVMVGGSTELGADTTLEAPASQMTIAQAAAFFEVFSLVESTIGLLTAAQYAGAGDTSLITAMLGEATFQATGLSDANWMIYASYLSTRLPMDILIGDAIVGPTIDAEGVGSLNSGLFTRHTIREMLYGWEDPIFTAVGLDRRWDGMFGKLFESPEAQDAAVTDTSRSYSRKTGTGSANAADAGDEVLWRGIAEFTKRDDVPGGSCEDDYTLIVRQDPDTCEIWTETETIAGLDSMAQNSMSSSDWTWDNYMEIPAENDELRMWSADLYRAISLVNSGDADLMGIHVHKYVINPLSLMGDCSDGVEPCNADNAKYRMSLGDGLIPMETAAAGAPMVASMPYFLNSDGSKITKAAECVDLSQIPQAAAWDDATLGSWLDVEPMTGKTLDAALRLQINFHVTDALLNGGVYPNLWTGDGCTDIIWPYLVIQDLGSLSADQAADFKDVIYGSIDMMRMIWLIAMAAGAALALCGTAVAIIGATHKEKASVSV